MNTNLYGRSFLSLLDFSAIEIRYLLDLAHSLKLKRLNKEPGNLLKGKNIVLIFEKPSSRTRCAFEIGAIEEGAHVTYLSSGSSQFGKKESVADSARVLSRFYHAIQYRGFEQQIVVDLAKYSNVPVYNGLTTEDHPTQILADLLTIEEKIKHKPLTEVKVVYVGDTRNNMANAWMYGCAKLGMDLVLCGPKELSPDTNCLQAAEEIASTTGSTIQVSEEFDCLLGADVVYTDAWVSMGEEDQIQNRVKLLEKYRITEDLLNLTKNPKVLFMHCLPAFHDSDTKFVQDAMANYGVNICEVTDEVFNGPHSVVFDEAENRLHTIKAIMVATLHQSKELV